jgi:hypothetical protein
MPTTAEYVRRYVLAGPIGAQSLSHSMVTKPLALPLGSGPFDNAAERALPGCWPWPALYR